MQPTKTRPNIRKHLENIFRVFLENGATTVLEQDKNRTVAEILKSLNSRWIEDSPYSDMVKSYFGLALTVGIDSDPKKSLELKRLPILHDNDSIEKIRELSYSKSLRLVYRMVYPPTDIKSLYRQNKFAFDYLYTQSCNDLKLERFNPQLDTEIALKLCALAIIEYIYSHHSNAHSSRKNVKSFLKLIKKSPGLAHFIPRSMVEDKVDKKGEKKIKTKLHEQIKEFFDESDPEIQKSKSVTNLDRYSGSSLSSLMPDLESSPVEYIKIKFLEYLAQLPCYGNAKPPIRGSSSSISRSSPGDYYVENAPRTPDSTFSLRSYNILPLLPTLLTQPLTDNDIKNLIVPPPPSRLGYTESKFCSNGFSGPRRFPMEQPTSLASYTETNTR